MNTEELKKLRCNYLSKLQQAEYTDSKKEDHKLRTVAWDIRKVLVANCNHPIEYVFITREASPENFDLIVHRTCFMCGHQEHNDDSYEEPKMKSSAVRIIKSFQFYEVFDFPLEP